MVQDNVSNYTSGSSFEEEEVDPEELKDEVNNGAFSVKTLKTY